MKKLIYPEKLVLDQNILAKTIYDSFPHLTYDIGVFIGEPIKNELRKFLKSYSEFLGIKQFHGNYFRIDVCITEQELLVVEINTQWLDGFGTALNLTRAAGFPLEINSGIVWFPEKWTTKKLEYIPEMKLACDELSYLGIGENYQILSFTEAKKILSLNPVFMYGVEKEIEKACYPRNGYSYDAKTNLAEFSRKWNGNSNSSHIKIPSMYWNKQFSWDKVPENVVFKLINKFEYPEIREELKRPIVFGKRDSYRKFYERGFLVGQEVIEGFQTIGVIMCVGTEPIAGYTQFKPVPSSDRIVNDNGSYKGPLIFED